MRLILNESKKMSIEESQNLSILNHLRSGRSITPLEALDMYGCFRLGARIHDLRSGGHEIKTIMTHKNGKRFATYELMRCGAV